MYKIWTRTNQEKWLKNPSESCRKSSLAFQWHDLFSSISNFLLAILTRFLSGRSQNNESFREHSIPDCHELTALQQKNSSPLLTQNTLLLTQQSMRTAVVLCFFLSWYQLFSPGSRVKRTQLLCHIRISYRRVLTIGQQTATLSERNHTRFFCTLLLFSGIFCIVCLQFLLVCLK